jgi:UDP-glucuronate 4-epimerase
MKKIYITGIAGFIGFHLARHLKKMGCEVSGCDNFNDYYDTDLKHVRASLLKKEGIAIAAQDIRHLDSLPAITHFVHLAAQAGVRYSLEKPQAYVDANLDGFVKVLEYCRHHKPIKLLFASSSSVYGLSSRSPFKEDDPCDRPASLYAATKRSNELLAYSYHHLFQIPMVGLRFFTVYGPYGRPDMAYFSFAQAIQQGKPIELFNHGEMERDFTYVDDIVAGIAAALDCDTPFDLFNLGNNRPERLSHLVTLLEKGLGREAAKILKPMQPGDVVSTCADLTKSRERLGYQPKVSLETGIGTFLDWYKQWTETLTRV